MRSTPRSALRAGALSVVALCAVAFPTLARADAGVGVTDVDPIWTGERAVFAVNGLTGASEYGFRLNVDLIPPGAGGCAQNAEASGQAPGVVRVVEDERLEEATAFVVSVRSQVLRRPGVWGVCVYLHDKIDWGTGAPDGFAETAVRVSSACPDAEGVARRLAALVRGRERELREARRARRPAIRRALRRDRQRLAAAQQHAGAICTAGP